MITNKRELKDYLEADRVALRSFSFRGADQ